MARRQLPGQPSLFGVTATDPVVEDLAGLLAGPGKLRRMGGTAQVSVRVDAAWRVHVLIAELGRRDLPGGWEATEGGFVVRTAFTTRLLALAGRWRHGAPEGLHLNGHALRLWVAAAGADSPDGYLLRLDPEDEASWPAVGAALSAAGAAGALAITAGGPAAGEPRSGEPASGPAYRVTGRRRRARLAELVGDPPDTAPPGAWPTPDPPAPTSGSTGG